MITGLTLSSAGSPHFFRERGDRAEHPANRRRQKAQSWRHVRLL
jgi:hypothetical protein